MAESTFSCVQWLTRYKEEIAKIKESSPFLSVLCISAGIEFLGKLLYEDSLDNGNGCGEKFNKALENFTSLNKYANKNLYNLIRCGLAHRISVKEDIKLDPNHESQLDTTPIIINPNKFFDDFAIAVDEAQTKTDWLNPNALRPYVTIKDNSETGATATMISYN